MRNGCQDLRLGQDSIHEYFVVNRAVICMVREYVGEWVDVVVGCAVRVA